MSDAQYIDKIKAGCIVNPETGCWEWQGYKHPKGYGEMAYRCKAWRLNRLSYFLHKGPIPEGLFVCHSCDVRHCVNPDHLWLGTNNDNVQDMRRKRRGNKQKKTICKRGHPLSGDNLGLRGPRQHRYCKICTQGRLWEKDQQQALAL